VLYRQLARPLLYRLSAETAHHLILGLLLWAQLVPLGLALLRLVYRRASRPVHALGLVFPSAVGLAAGFDKDGRVFDALGALGFGFVEIGTITHEAQPGNPKPRLFRLPLDRALVNRMGFNNEGARAAAIRLLARGTKGRPILGINIGKTKVVAAEGAAQDYESSTRLLAPYADYLVVNVSSPNTPGLRDLQSIEALRPILTRVRAAALEVVPARRVPLLVKIAPDLSDDDVLAVADLALELRLEGIIAANTTISRAGLQSDPKVVESLGAGGLSGAPVRARALEVLRLLRDRVGASMTLISVGGLETPDDAKERLAQGATLVQVYSALVYEGPSLAGRISAALRSA